MVRLIFLKRSEIGGENLEVQERGVVEKMECSGGVGLGWLDPTRADVNINSPIVPSFRLVARFVLALTELVVFCSLKVITLIRLMISSFVGNFIPS
jgi:hypothetical protein